MDYVYFLSQGHYGRPRGFCVILSFLEEIYSKLFFRSCYICIRHSINTHFRLTFIPNLVFHDPTSAVPWTEIGHESDVTGAFQNEIVISNCSPLEIVDFKWVLNKKYQKRSCLANTILVARVWKKKFPMKSTQFRKILPIHFSAKKNKSLWKSWNQMFFFNLYVWSANCNDF